ncbi:MAG: 2-oxoglutarate dehydrogenase complex dihydrolipoyllysine-residue succinyltransferase [Spirochaetaceae bacterium]|nr:MAG: 2-oxoglutarate dehydrogenase complex dihydrolipoyllysine-residue succinyltransferase [Spirochaetaceae bacterium]
MKKEIAVPEIGESISSGILAAWLKDDGATVAEGEEIFELETDKATLGVPSPAAGVLHRGASEGDEVEVGQVVGSIDTESSEASEDAEPKSADRAPAESSDESTEGAPETLSPAVRRVVAEHGIDPAKITGTGKDGRITKEDALAAARDGSRKPTETAQRASTTGSLPAPSMPTNDRQRRVPLSNLRKRIAENLVYSRQTSAHVTTFNEIDMSAVMEIRTRHKESFNAQHGVRLGFMSFFVKAAQCALEAYPEVNAYLDGTDVLYNDYVSIGVALSSEKGLLTPVIKDVATRDFASIEKQIIDFIDRANAKRLKPDEMVGATFTISNGGVFGSLLSTPIPSPPQTAVLGMHAIEKRPVVVADQIVARPMMYAALTYDHRMIDGREAVLFLGKIKELIEDPTRLLLGL